MIAKLSPTTGNGQGPKPGRSLLVVGGILIGGFVLHCVAVNYISDDAFISFRYVRNFLQGHGLVFNPGERVEGYTDFLWVLLLAGLQSLLPAVSLLKIAQAAGVLFGALTIWMALRFSWDHRQPFWPWGTLAGTFLAAHSGFAAWSTGGLEGSLFACLVLGGAWAHVGYLETQRRFWAAPLLFALAAVTRPDGLLFLGLTGLHLVFAERARTGEWMNRRVLLWGLVFALLYMPYFFWRYAYYGYLFPNTFYAKSASGDSWFMYLRGLRYLRDYFLTYGAYLPLFLLVVLWRKKQQAWVGYFALLVLAYFLYIVSVGGDGLAFYRFVAYVAPLFYLLIQEGIAELHDWLSRAVPAARGPAFTGAAVLLVLVMLGLTIRQSATPILLPSRAMWHEPQSGLYFPGGTEHSYRWFDNYFVDRLATAARWLEQNAPPNALVATTPAGSVSYHTRLRVIDMLGLNDVHIAHTSGTFLGGAGLGRAGHEKGDGEYVLSREPDYILLGNVAVLPFPLDEKTMGKKLVLKSEHELWAVPEFHQRYELVCISLANSGVFRYFTFYRKKQMAALSGKSAAQVAGGLGKQP